MTEYIGIDIGATHIRAVRLRDFAIERSETLGKWRTPKTFQGVQKILYPICQSSNSNGIGVSVAGVVMPGQSQIEEAPHIFCLNGVEVQDLLPDFKGEIRLDNDARCFLRAELAAGSAKGSDNAVGIVFGTGIGVAIWQDGGFHVGEDGRAGELGHSVKSGKELEELIREQFKKTGDASNAYAEIIGEVIRIFTPDLVVVGGGPIAEGKYDLGILRKKIDASLEDDAKTSIVFGAFGDLSQAIGAALLFQE